MCWRDSSGWCSCGFEFIHSKHTTRKPPYAYGPAVLNLSPTILSHPHTMLNYASCECDSVHVGFHGVVYPLERRGGVSNRLLSSLVAVAPGMYMPPRRRFASAATSAFLSAAACCALSLGRMCGKANAVATTPMLSARCVDVCLVAMYLQH